MGLGPRHLIDECRSRGWVLVVEGGNRLRVRGKGKPDEDLLRELQVHKREVLALLLPKPSPPLPAWTVTEEDLRQVVPGSPERQDFRRRVIDLCGGYWLACPVTIRESILSRHFKSRDHLAAAAEILRFMGRGS